MNKICSLRKNKFYAVRQNRMGRIYILFTLIIITSPYAFTSGNFNSGMPKINLQNFQIFSGSGSDRELMLARNFNLPVFMPYNNEKLKNIEDGDNYHVFKTSFTVSNAYRNKDLTLYISRHIKQAKEIYRGRCNNLQHYMRDICICSGR